MIEAIAAALVLLGSVFMLLAAVGVWRLPDVYTRLSATSKAATLGAACVLAAGALHFHETGVSSRALAAIFFVMITAPVAAHAIGRAAYLTGVPLWEGTRLDEMREHLKSDGGAAPEGAAGRERPDP